MDPQTAAATLSSAEALLSTVGAPLSVALVSAAGALILLSVVPGRRDRRRTALALTVALLGAGELLFVWFHWQLYRVAAVVEPQTGRITGHIAVPVWVESEKLYVWALLLGVMALAARRHRTELEPLLGAFVGVLTAGAVLISRPFTQPLPDFLGLLKGYLAVRASTDVAAQVGAFQQMDAQRQYFYNTPFMWVHPPMLFFSYGAFVVSFAAVVLMVRSRSGAFETTAYRWARFGYLPLTAGMLLGFPWAIMAWQGESWWWSGKVNMSIMMWLLYTGYLHGRLYLRRRGMWKVVAALAVLSFAALVLTYLATYVIPGTHSVA